MSAPTLTPPASETLVEFIRGLSAPEVRRILEADPLGVAMLATPGKTESDWRELAFDTLRARPTFWGQVRTTLAAERAQRDAQMLLPFGRVRR